MKLNRTSTLVIGSAILGAILLFFYFTFSSVEFTRFIVVERDQRVVNNIRAGQLNYKQISKLALPPKKSFVPVTKMGSVNIEGEPEVKYFIKTEEKSETTEITEEKYLEIKNKQRITEESLKKYHQNTIEQTSRLASLITIYSNHKRKLIHNKRAFCALLYQITNSLKNLSKLKQNNLDSSVVTMFEEAESILQKHSETFFRFCGADSNGLRTKPFVSMIKELSILKRDRRISPATANMYINKGLQEIKVMQFDIENEIKKLQKLKDKEERNISRLVEGYKQRLKWLDRQSSEINEIINN